MTDAQVHGNDELVMHYMMEFYFRVCRHDPDPDHRGQDAGGPLQGQDHRRAQEPDEAGPQDRHPAAGRHRSDRAHRTGAEGGRLCGAPGREHPGGRHRAGRQQRRERERPDRREHPGGQGRGRSRSAPPPPTSPATSGAVATRVGEDTTLAQIIRMVSDAAATKAPIAKIADTVSGFFVPAVICIAVVTTLVWLLLGRDVGLRAGPRHLRAGHQLPLCAGSGNAGGHYGGQRLGRKNGILFKTAASLEDRRPHPDRGAGQDRHHHQRRAHRHRPSARRRACTETELLTLAAALERRSEHPLARAVLACAEERQLELPPSYRLCRPAGQRPYRQAGGQGDLCGGNAAFIGTKVALPARCRSRPQPLAARRAKRPLLRRRRPSAGRYRRGRHHQGGQPRRPSGSCRTWASGS